MAVAPPFEFQSIDHQREESCNLGRASSPGFRCQVGGTHRTRGLDVGLLPRKNEDRSASGNNRTLQYRVAESKFIVEVRAESRRQLSVLPGHNLEPRPFDEPIVRCKFRWNVVGSRDGRWPGHFGSGSDRPLLETRFRLGVL